MNSSPRARSTQQNRRRWPRRGQALVEFSLVALVLYLMLAAILTFGHALYVAQTLQSSADVAAREISRTGLDANITFEDALAEDAVRSSIFDDAWLVIDLAEFYTANPGGNVFSDLVPQMPVLNQQLALVMIVDRPDTDGDGTADEWLLRYPGALLERQTDASPPPGNQYPAGVAVGYTVGIPLVSSRAADGTETIEWVPVVEEIDDDDPASPDPFQISHDQRGLVALRINYPFQSASMSSFRPNPAGQFEPTVGSPNAASGVTPIAAPDGTNFTDAGLTQTLPNGEVVYSGTYGGRYGLGAQGALGSPALVGVDGNGNPRPVRPFRRLITSQAIYRREIFN